jgi:hypothetical protein
VISKTARRRVYTLAAIGATLLLLTNTAHTITRVPPARGFEKTERRDAHHHQQIQPIQTRAYRAHGGRETDPLADAGGFHYSETPEGVRY